MSFTFTTLKSAIQDYVQNDETVFLSQLPLFIRMTEERILKNIQLSLFQKNVGGNFSSGNKYLALPADFLAPISLSATNSSDIVFLDFKDANFVQSFNPNSSTTGTPRYYARFDNSNFIIGPTPDASYVTEVHYYYRPTSLADSTIVLTVGAASSFAVNEVITGASSGATATISSKNDGTNQLTIIVPTTAFTSGETVTGGTTGHSSAISAISSDTTTTWLSKNARSALLYGALYESYIFMKGEPDILTLYEKRFTEELMRLKDLGESRENADAYRQGLPRRPRT